MKLSLLCIVGFTLGGNSEYGIDAPVKPCDGPLRVRPSVYDLTDEQWDVFVNAVKKMNSGDRPTKWDLLAKLHTDIYPSIHSKASFLAWHRGFLFALESELRNIDSSVVLPYWDWSYHSQEPEKDPIFDARRLGFDGHDKPDGCVMDGSFADFKVYFDGTSAPPKEHCLKRNFKRQDQKVEAWLSPDLINRVILQGKEFKDVWTGIEHGPHGVIHNTIGADFSGHASPSDPLFYLHHAFVDKLWVDWAKRKEGRETEYISDDSISFDTPVIALNYNLTEMIDNEKYLCYTYAEDHFERKVDGKVLPFKRGSKPDSASEDSTKDSEKLPDDTKTAEDSSDDNKESEKESEDNKHSSVDDEKSENDEKDSSVDNKKSENDEKDSSVDNKKSENDEKDSSVDNKKSENDEKDSSVDDKKSENVEKDSPADNEKPDEDGQKTTDITSGDDEKPTDDQEATDETSSDKKKSTDDQKITEGAPVDNEKPKDEQNTTDETPADNDKSEDKQKSVDEIPADDEKSEVKQQSIDETPSDSNKPDEKQKGTESSTDSTENNVALEKVQGLSLDTPEEVEQESSSLVKNTGSKGKRKPSALNLQSSEDESSQARSSQSKGSKSQDGSESTRTAVTTTTTTTTQPIPDQKTLPRLVAPNALTRIGSASDAARKSEDEDDDDDDDDDEDNDDDDVVPYSDTGDADSKKQAIVPKKAFEPFRRMMLGGGFESRSAKSTPLKRRAYTVTPRPMPYREVECDMPQEQAKYDYEFVMAGVKAPPVSDRSDLKHIRVPTPLPVDFLKKMGSPISLVRAIERRFALAVDEINRDPNYVSSAALINRHNFPKLPPPSKRKPRKCRHRKLRS
ncbi:hypothetical protein DSO57_1000590 [Entomophthora muscae]|uniref:Uncharacterized protein n=1 Tax=Entomophthora muscae TaxID=34485 RepID=A0ACC2S0A8_9FUNG|nr:hypothetical protein DSO57_1000590 [Entomophthora muscae]